MNKFCHYCHEYTVLVQPLIGLQDVFYFLHSPVYFQKNQPKFGLFCGQNKEQGLVADWVEHDITIRRANIDLVQIRIHQLG